MVSSIPWDTTHSYSGIVGSDSTPERNSVSHPIVFIHGNGRDETDWSKHFAYLSSQGISKERLWAIGFDNSDLRHKTLARQLEDFVTNLFEYTRDDVVSLVMHSLGVTVGRFWMHKYNRYENVHTFIGIAGANHGVAVCTPHQMSKLLPKSHRYKPCQEVSQHSWTGTKLDWLNTEIGETPGDVRYYTIRGTEDSIFAGCPDSPRLEGAEENVVLDTDHDGAREDMEALERIHYWLTDTQ